MNDFLKAVLLFLLWKMLPYWAVIILGSIILGDIIIEMIWGLLLHWIRTPGS